MSGFGYLPPGGPYVNVPPLGIYIVIGLDLNLLGYICYILAPTD